MAAAPAFIVEAPVIVKPPDAWVMAPPLEVAVRIPPTVPVPRFNAPVDIAVRLPVGMLRVPKVNAFVSVIWTLLAPVFVRDTAPVKLLAWVRVIAAPPVVKLDVPVTVNTAPWVIAPPEVTERLPFTVWPVRAMAAVVVRVKLPFVVKAARPIAVEPLSRVMCAAFNTVV